MSMTVRRESWVTGTGHTLGPGRNETYGNGGRLALGLGLGTGKGAITVGRTGEKLRRARLAMAFVSVSLSASASASSDHEACISNFVHAVLIG
jgi:hypothetical protein